METIKKIENVQVKKFNERVVKSKGKNPNSPTIVKRFNFIDLTHAVRASTEAKVRKDKPVKTRFKSTPTKEKNWILPTITDITNIETMSGSIARFINECHPDVRTFIQKGEIASMKAGSTSLIVTTKRGMRVVITPNGYHQRHIRITDKKTVLFDGNTIVKIEKEEKKDQKNAKAA